DFEVVGCAQDELLGLRLARIQELLVIRQSDIQRAVVVTHTSGHCTAVIASFEFARTVYIIHVERVTDTGLETAPGRGLIHHHVVVANRVSGAERRTHGGVQVAEREGINAREVLRSDVGLTTQVQTAPAFALQTDGGLTTKQAITLAAVTVAGAETAFQHEHSLQAITQIFGATQTPARTALDTVGHADTRLVV